ncbi:ATP-binding protein [Herbidospora mongoliensis]|uniref:ATP-binding protein n=1 Tax=Herbidospora mongoliensis TaxID=688067 RepID=UPI00082E6BA1|nr:AAA family ATPase [Herbidospora mongoliensis]
MSGDGLVGRDADVEGIEKAFLRTRLVTLTGPPGAGKTALARVVAAKRGAHVVDADAGPSALAEIGLMAGDGFLVVDGCDRVLELLVPYIGVMLQRRPGLAILATCRQSLALPGERVVALRELEPEHRVELLARLGVTAPPEMMRRVDGLPLTLVLLAAALKRGETDGPLLDLLWDPEHDGPFRHAAMRTAIGWSHEQCTPEERLVWARTSVFADGFDLEAAQAVCGDDDVTPAVAALVDKSLVVRSETRGVVRFHLPATVREFGAEWLGRAGEREATEDRHFRHYRTLARQAEAEWQGGQLRWYRRMRLERGNLIKALDSRLTDPHGADDAQDLAGTLWFLWACCGLQREGADQLARVRAAGGSPGPERDKALWTAAWLHAALGDPDAAEEALYSCTNQGPARLTQVSAWVAAQRGAYPEALRLIRDAREGHRRDADLFPGFLPSYTVIVTTLLRMGDLTGAVTVLREGRDLCVATGEIWTRSHLDHLLAQAELLRGDPPAALTSARGALTVARQFGDTAALAAGVELVGVLTRNSALMAAADQAWAGMDGLRSPVLAEIRDRRPAITPEPGLGFDDAVALALDDSWGGEAW